jgi:hypothetical protein
LAALLVSPLSCLTKQEITLPASVPGAAWTIPNLAKTSWTRPAGERRSDISDKLLATGKAYFYIALNAIVYTLGIRHVLQHDIADTQGTFSKSNLEYFDGANLTLAKSAQILVGLTSLTAS